VSVLVAFHNRAEYLEESVRSVFADTSAALEVVLIDDGSTDGAEVIAASFADRAVVVRQEHRGCPAAWNLGLDRARGDLIAFCDSDDIWTADRTSVLVDALGADPTLDAVFGLVTEFVSPELAPDQVVTRAPHDVSRGPVSGAMLARRTVFDRVGRFDESLRHGFWFDWYARLVDAGVRTADVDAVVLRRRLHTQNMSIVQSDLLSEYARALHGALVRRRASGVRGAES
jgi:glycosyltransferase involved in cell wall biosynthesis